MRIKDNKINNNKVINNNKTNNNIFLNNKRINDYYEGIRLMENKNISIKIFIMVILFGRKNYL